MNNADLVRKYNYSKSKSFTKCKYSTLKSYIYTPLFILLIWLCHIMPLRSSQIPFPVSSHNVFLCTSHHSRLLFSLLLDYCASLRLYSPSCLITSSFHSSVQQPYKFTVADVAMRENGFSVHLQTLQIPAALVLSDFTGRRVAGNPIIPLLSVV